MDGSSLHMMQWEMLGWVLTPYDAVGNVGMGPHSI